jgi:Uncharacterized protein conserved in bacteria
MEEVVYYNKLYDMYGELLTDTQKKYFEDYYFNNLSYSEMSETYGVSRNAIFKQLKFVTNKLIEYEDKLKLLDKINKISEIISSKISKEEMDKINQIFNS